MNESEYILVSGSTVAAQQFIQYLKFKAMPFVVLTNNDKEREQMNKIGVEHMIEVDTSDHETWALPPYEIGKVFIFEKSLTLCCRYLKMSRKWTIKPIYVITTSDKPRMVYKGLGADFVVYSNTGNVVFLLN
ncbi:hypothetical protein GK047_20130 [Paenibacillus sp. SYP-B3998]|uniref:Uncharacterized protein n=1 Tax=Paenibacillus sp. SYP-B3998 TaxID=2678564 RepID=A0A6G4A301_9BACL|nr:hypothetical protein [Paenibacillus sp. SYP-B3998]NEW08314.1 hypothetical protein [Paenibacillus sp. SYP-B3998]